MNKKLLLLIISLINLVIIANTSNIDLPDDIEYIKENSRKKKRKEREREWEKKEAELKAKEELENRSQLSFVGGDSIPVLTVKNSPNPADNKQVSFFCYPLVFTDEGISSFFNHSFNREEYGKEFLPHNLSHLSQIICHGQSHGLSKEFTEGAIRLFHQKIKSCPYMSAPAMEKFLDTTAPYLEMQLAKREFGLWSEIKNSLVESFKAQFSFLQADPLGFFDHISKELDEKINRNVISPERARATLVKFLNSSLDKVIWSPDDQERTWDSLKKIGRSIEYLQATQVIPDHLDANDLYWSLIERYCYFLELVGTKLNLETIQYIKRDIAEKNVPWLLASEQEKGITTKLERLAQSVIETEARILAKNNGIFTEKYLFSASQ